MANSTITRTTEKDTFSTITEATTIGLTSVRAIDEFKRDSLICITEGKKVFISLFLA